MNFECPKCNVPMTHESSGNVPLWLCSDCKGHWLDFDAMKDRITDAESFVGVLSRVGTTAGLNCPACKDRPLSRARYRRCEVDWCPACRGVFFDPGEIAAVQAELRDGAASGLRGMTSDMVGNVAGEIVEVVAKLLS